MNERGRAGAEAGETVHLLVNTASRRGQRDGDAVAELIRQTGRTVIPIVCDTADRVAAAIAEQGSEIDRLVLVGGDGLIHRALLPLAESGISVGIVASGTGNDFARSVGLPRKRQAAVLVALGPTRAVDLLLIEASDGSVEWAATVVTGGFSGRVNARADRLRFPPGQQKYTAATLHELRTLAPVEISVTVSGAGRDDVRYGPPCTFFAVGNTAHFGGGMAICPEARPDDGLLQVTHVDPVSSWRLLRMLPTVFFGRHVRHPAVHTAAGTRVGVETVEELWADGELLGPGPVEIELRPGALELARS